VSDARAGCNWRVGDFQTLRSWECDCEGFRPLTGALSEAAFAAVSPGPEGGASISPLRLASFDGHVEV
jgi:hypothetical protein